MAQANAFLTSLKRDPCHAYLNEVSSVPLQQVLRTQQRAFTNFYAKRARHPRRKTRLGRQAAEFTIDRWYPSTKTCSSCGCVLSDIKLSTRAWTCPGCGTPHERDLNAAKNILAAGLAVTACGDGVRHRGPFRGATVNEAGTPTRKGGSPHL